MATTSPSLLHRLKNGSANTLAWNRFVEMYTPLLMHWIMRMGLHRDEAADVAQEVMLALMVRMPSFQYEPESSFRAWLRTVTLNKTRDYLRRNKTRRQHESLKVLETPPSADSIFTDAEFHQAIARRALELMKNEFEETTWRACWESTVRSRKATEIADELGISVNAVYLAKGRVLKRLRHELDGML
jgi:RNA polymerase sigma-70 factor (ECF subfamily)